MTIKLTLSVGMHVIQKAKQYARRHKRSFYEIVTSYFSSLSAGTDASAKIDPEVRAIGDQIPADKIPELEDARYRYLKEKYP